MAKRSKRATANRRGGMPRPVAIVLLVVLAVAVAGISYLALKTPVARGGGIPASGPVVSIAPTPTPDAEPQSAQSGTPTTQPNPEPTVTAAALVAPDRLLAMVDGTVMARATIGTCTLPGAMEISRDGGVSWAPTIGLTQAGATQILRVVPTSADLIQVAAMNQDCQPSLYTTEDLGASWAALGSAQGAWYLVTPRTVGTPTGTAELPCDAVAFAGVEDRAAALCADSTVITTGNQAQSWSTPVAVPGAVALGVAPDNGYFLATANQPGCAGIKTLALRGGALTAPGACLAAPVAGGNVAVARAGDLATAWVGDTFAVSTTGGVEW